MSGRSTAPPTRRVLIVLISALVIDMLAFTCILPLFPSILSLYSTPDHRDALYDASVSALQSFQNLIGVPYNERYNNVFFGGLLGSLFSALQFIASPTLGALSDVYGRRTMLLLSAVGTLISYMVWLRAETFTVFVISRLIGGLSKANVNVAMAIIADIYRPKDHPKGMALIGIAYSLGFLVGPMIGAYFTTFTKQAGAATFHFPAQFSIVMTMLQFSLVFCFLPETLDFNEAKSRKSVTEKAGELLRPVDLFKFTAVDVPTEKRTRLEKIGNIYFLYLFLYAGLEFTLPFLTHLRFNFGSLDQSKLYLFTGLLMLIIQGGFVRRAPLERQQKLAETGIMCIIPAYLLIAFASSVPQMYFGLALYAISSATVVPALTSLMSAVHVETERGAVSGVFRSIGALARALGPFAAATLFWLVGAEICYVSGGILLSIPLLLLRKLPPVEGRVKND